MYCKNCGNPMDLNAVVCTKCGCSKGTGVSYCPNCAQPTIPGAAVCTKCGCALNTMPGVGAKSKLVAGLLGIFLGSLGVHNFYLGYTNKAIIQLLVATIGGLITCGIASFVIGVWGLVEGILLLCDKITVDGKGQPLKD